MNIGLGIGLPFILAGTAGLIQKLFVLGRDISWHWQFDDPNDLYRRRNRLTYSRTPGNAAWLKTRSSVGASAEVDPDGYPAVKLIEDTTATNNHYLLQSISPPLGQTHGAWFDVKAGERTRVILVMFALASSECIFDLSTGALVSKGASASAATITPRGGGWYRVFATWPTITAGAGAAILLDNGTTSNYTGDGVSGVHVSKAHFEYGATVAPEYQDVHTTWAQAYLDAVGAERIYAWADAEGVATPVTSIGEGIGFLQDRSFSGFRGPALITGDSRTFASMGDWAAINANVAVSATGGRLRMTQAGALGTSGGAYLAIPTEIGKQYRFVVSLATAHTGGQNTFIGAGTSPGTNGLVSLNLGGAAGIGRRAIVFKAATTTTYINLYTSVVWNPGTYSELDDAECYWFPGTHLTQATGTAKPTLSARVNLLLNSDAPSWSLTNGGTGVLPVVTPNAATAPDGKTTAQRVQLNRGAGDTSSDFSAVQLSIGGGTVGVGYRAGIHLKSNTGLPQTLAVYTNTGGSIDSKLVTVGASWEFIPSVTHTATVTNIGVVTLISRGGTWAANNGLGGDRTLDLLVWGADLRTADDAAKNIPAYQRVGATAADHDTDGFPHYAEGDGTDNCWASVATVDGSATDKLTVVAAVTKNSDAAAGCVLETTTNLATDGAIALWAPPGANSNVVFYSRGTASSSATFTGLAAPITRVMTGSGDVSADLCFIEANGAGRVTAATDQGTGNYANATLYVLSRAGTSFRFNGRFYGSTGRFGPMSDGARRALYDYWRAHCRLP